MASPNLSATTHNRKTDLASTITPLQLNTLLTYFQTQPYLKTGTAILLAHDTGLSYNIVQRWFTAERDRMTKRGHDFGSRPWKQDSHVATVMLGVHKREPEAYVELLRSGRVDLGTGRCIVGPEEMDRGLGELLARSGYMEDKVVVPKSVVGRLNGAVLSNKMKGPEGGFGSQNGFLGETILDYATHYPEYLGTQYSQSYTGEVVFDERRDSQGEGLDGDSVSHQEKGGVQQTESYATAVECEDAILSVELGDCQVETPSETTVGYGSYAGSSRDGAAVAGHNTHQDRVLTPEQESHLPAMGRYHDEAVYSNLKSYLHLGVHREQEAYAPVPARFPEDEYDTVQNGHPNVHLCQEQESYAPDLSSHIHEETYLVQIGAPSRGFHHEQESYLPELNSYQAETNSDFAEDYDPAFESGFQSEGVNDEERATKRQRLDREGEIEDLLHGLSGYASFEDTHGSTPVEPFEPDSTDQNAYQNENRYQNRTLSKERRGIERQRVDRGSKIEEVHQGRPEYSNFEEWYQYAPVELVDANQDAYQNKDTHQTQKPADIYSEGYLYNNSHSKPAGQSPNADNRYQKQPEYRTINIYQDPYGSQYTASPVPKDYSYGISDDGSPTYYSHGQTPPPPRPRLSRNNGITCPHCSLAFPNASILIAHSKSVHAGSKAFECLECGKGFGRKDALDIHGRNVHRKERRFQCEKCGQRFARGDGLRSHVGRGCVDHRVAKCRSKDQDGDGHGKDGDTSPSAGDFGAAQTARGLPTSDGEETFRLRTSKASTKRGRAADEYPAPGLRLPRVDGADEQ